MKVVDNAPTASKANGFVDSASNSVDDYSYDANGNMTKDNNKNITSITYNHLNLPTLITFATTGNIVYIYNASGQKVQKIVNETARPAITTDYLGGYQYENATLKFFPTAEGYIEPSGSSYKYVYQYKDHLGNIRLSYDKNLVIQEENNYYPFGLKHKGDNTVIIGAENKYKYNGKELQDELGLNFYDYGARNYDPALGRWMNIDNMAEKYLSSSPYHYAGNNPVLYLDIDGNEFTESAWKWVNRLIADINSRQGKNNKSIADYQSKISGGGTEKQIAKWNKSINNLQTNNQELEATRGETATLAASSQVYDVENDNSGTERDAIGNSTITNQTYYKTQNDRVTITVSSGTDLGLFSHELKHAFQFETGQTSLSFDRKPVVNFLHDGFDEVEGYQRGQLFGQRENINTPADLSSKGLYGGLQTGPITIHNYSYGQMMNSNNAALNYLAKQKQQAFRINNTTYNGKR
ncbi:RHS repeat domain-containing protein [Flavobacterium sp.]|uniref:RHS repeat domain-containing protein n=1 Tax=Flavobacterium sp. TaxID=239 RepID=UPI003D113E8B